MNAVPRKVPDTPKQWSISTTRDTSLSQRTSFQTGEGKVRENHAPMM